MVGSRVGANLGGLAGCVMGQAKLIPILTYSLAIFENSRFIRNIKNVRDLWEFFSYPASINDGVARNVFNSKSLPTFITTAKWRSKTVTTSDKVNLRQARDGVYLFLEFLSFIFSSVQKEKET
jgi:hypothetical protein